MHLLDAFIIFGQTIYSQCFHTENTIRSLSESEYTRQEPFRFLAIFEVSHTKPFRKDIFFNFNPVEEERCDRYDDQYEAYPIIKCYSHSQEDDQKSCIRRVTNPSIGAFFHDLMLLL